MLTTIQAALSNIDGKIDSLTYRVDKRSERLDKHTERLDMAERRLSEAEDDQVQIDAKQKKMEKQLAGMTAKAEDLEARSCRSNISLMGISETTNMGPMERYVEQLLISMLGRETFSDIFIVERAHRSLAPRPPTGSRPRPIIAKILNYRDRDAALQKARELGQLTHEGMNISLYPDFTSSVQEARKKFATVKQKLRYPSIPYPMLYPARLKITVDGKTKIFNEPGDTMKFAQQKGQTSVRRKSSRGDQGGIIQFVGCGGITSLIPQTYQDTELSLHGVQLHLAGGGQRTLIVYDDPLKHWFR